MRFVLGLALVSVLFIARPDQAAAQVVLDDLVTTTSEIRGAGTPVVANVTVTAPTSIVRISTLSEGLSPHNQKFVIYNLTTSTFLYVSPPKAFPADTGPTIKTSDPFAALTLMPGNTYLIGATADIGTTQYYGSGNVTQGAVTNVSANGNLFNYATPTINCCHGVRSALRLEAAPPPASVPTMSEWAMILFALMLAGGAAMMIQRRRLA